MRSVIEPSAGPSLPAVTHSPRPSAPRLPPMDPGTLIGSELAEVLAKTAIGDGQVLNIFGTLAHQPTLLKRFNVPGGPFWPRGCCRPGSGRS